MSVWFCIDTFVSGNDYSAVSRALCGSSRNSIIIVYRVYRMLGSGKSSQFGTEPRREKETQMFMYSCTECGTRNYRNRRIFTSAFSTVHDCCGNLMCRVYTTSKDN